MAKLVDELFKKFTASDPSGTNTSVILHLMEDANRSSDDVVGRQRAINDYIKEQGRFCFCGSCEDAAATAQKIAVDALKGEDCDIWKLQVMVMATRNMIEAYINSLIRKVYPNGIETIKDKDELAVVLQMMGKLFIGASARTEQIAEACVHVIGNEKHEAHIEHLLKIMDGNDGQHAH